MSKETDGNADQIQQRTLQAIQKMSLMEDVFFNVAMAYTPAALEKIIRIVIGDNKLAIRGGQLQSTIRSLIGHSVILDAKAVLTNGAIVNVEMQRKSEGASPKRSRYNGSMLDVNGLAAGMPYAMLPDTYIIFITQTNVLHSKKGVRRFDMRDEEGFLRDGKTVIYVNGEYQGTDEVGMLIHDLHCIDYHEIHTKELREAVQFIKENPKGVQIMSDIIKEIFGDEIQAVERKVRAEGRAEGRADTLLALVTKKLLSVSDAAQELGVSTEEFEELLKEYKTPA